jgi:hypothetical protein
MRYCEYCKRAEGTEHITVIVDAFGPTASERFYAQFWLCPDCVKALGQLFVRDDGLKGRIASALLRAAAGIQK